MISEPVVPEKVVTVRPYRATDPPEMLPSAATAATMAALPDPKEIWEEYARSSHAWTLVVNDTIVGCAGLRPFPYPGVAHAWLLASPHMTTYPMSVVLAIVETLRQLIREHGFWRIECVVDETFPAGRRLVEYLGFTPEQDGRARAMGPQRQTMIRYEWLHPDVTGHAG